MSNDADPMIETIITRVTEQLDACLAALKRDLCDEFGARHDALERRMATLENLVAASAADIKHDTGFTRTIAVGAFAGTGASPPRPATPEADAPRPLDIDRAVAADPSEGDQRVDLPDYGAVFYLQPGQDAETAWTGARTAIREGRAGGLRRPRRAEGR